MIVSPALAEAGHAGRVAGRRQECLRGAANFVVGIVGEELEPGAGVDAAHAGQGAGEPFADGRVGVGREAGDLQLARAKAELGELGAGLGGDGFLLGVQVADPSGLLTGEPGRRSIGSVLDIAYGSFLRG